MPKFSILTRGSILLLILGCGQKFLVPNPPQIGLGEKTLKEEVVKIEREPVSPIDTSYRESLTVSPIEEKDSLREVLQESAAFEPEDNSDTVRVCIYNSKKAVRIFSSDEFIVKSLNDDKARFAKLTGAWRISMKNGKGVLYNSRYYFKDISFPIVLSSITSIPIEIDSNNYDGKFTVYNTDEGIIRIVNSVPIETYLRGVVPLEIGKKAFEYLEAVKAQAVAARTYTYYQIKMHHQREFDLYNDINDQVYKGCMEYHPTSDRAIRETSGLVLIDSAGGLIKAYYHSTCGGITANCREVWVNKDCYDYLKSVDDGNFCAESGSFKWSYKWTAGEMNRIIKKSLMEINNTSASFGILKNVSIVKYTSEGRVALLRIETTKGNFDVYGDQCRWVLRRKEKGFPILWSAFFNLSYDHGVYHAKGRGYGHGVGMCQAGALGRSLKGESFSRILYKYYSGVRLIQKSKIRADLSKME